MVDQNDNIQPFEEFSFSGRFSMNETLNSSVFDGTFITLRGTFFADGNIRTGEFFGNPTPGLPWDAVDARVGDIFVDPNGQRYEIVGFNITPGFTGTDFNGTAPTSSSMRIKAYNNDSSGFGAPSFYTVFSGGQGIIMRGSDGFGFSMTHTVSTNISETLQQSMQQRSLAEIGTFLRDIGNLGNVNITTPIATNVLEYDGTVWINGTGSSSVVNTSSPLTGDGSGGDPITLIDGTMKSQHLRYDGTMWNTNLSAYDGLVAATGTQFSTINDAISAGCKRIAVLTDTTQTAQAVLSGPTTIQIFNEATISNSPLLASAIDCNSHKLSITGGAIDWSATTDGTGLSYYIENNGSDTQVDMNNLSFTYANAASNRNITNQDLTLDNCSVQLNSSDNSGFHLPGGRSAQLTNIIFNGSAGIEALKVDGYLSSSNITLSGLSNGTEVVLNLNGEVNMQNITIDDTADVYMETNGTGSAFINGLTSSGNIANITLNNANSALDNARRVNSIVVNNNKSKLFNCNQVVSLNINGDNSKVTHFEGSAIIINGSNAKMSFVDLGAGSFTGTATDSFIANSSANSITLSPSNRNKISMCDVNTIDITGDQNIVIGNRVTDIITIQPLGSNNILNGNLTDNGTVTTGTIGTVLSGNTQF